eukprot:29570-Pelagococcus_subviridis.AAC.8
MSLRISASSNSVAIAPVDEEMTLGRVRQDLARRRPPERPTLRRAELSAERGARRRTRALAPVPAPLGRVRCEVPA